MQRERFCNYAVKINIISTYGIRCGVAENTRQLAEALATQGHSITILANKPSGKNPQDVHVGTDTVIGADLKIIRCWSVTGWSGEELFGGPEFEASLDADIVNWQFQNFLYTEKMQEYIGQLYKNTKTKLVATVHDSGIGPKFPRDLVDFYLASSKTVLRDAGISDYLGTAIPHGAVNRAPVVMTFGLGRSRADMIQAACGAIGAEFRVAPWQNWTWNKDDFLDSLKAADVLVLAYPDVGASVCSSSIRDALATYRPVLVTTTKWFEEFLPRRDLVTFCPGTEEGIADGLRLILGERMKWLQDNSWVRSAERHIEVFERVRKRVSL